LSLALQGGGFKVVQYIGAYKAKRACVPNLKITSIIGSSAGSILGLAICLNMPPE
jgi:predicted acylesterase/phospholipase RssA